MLQTLDRARFAKILALAESPCGPEALAAVRKAIVIARAAGLSLGEAVTGNFGADRENSSYRSGYDQGRESGFAAGVKTGHVEAEAMMNSAQNSFRFEAGFMAATETSSQNESSVWHAGRRNWTV